MRSIVAILDWGLGHASRCIPLIRRLQVEGDDILVVSAGSALKLVEAECSDINTKALPAYAIRYPGDNMVWNMTKQGPRILRTIWQEHIQLRQIVKEFQADRIISDGRFGCYYTGIKNIWLAHQLQIQHASPTVRWLANSLYHAHIRRHFQQIWIPDYSDVSQRLSGHLADPIQPLPATYLGPLSRYKDTTQLVEQQAYEWLFLLSGPEPQRSNLEEQLLSIAQKIGQRVLLVRGVAGTNDLKQVHKWLNVVDWLHGDDLAQAVATSKQILCRSGYSTLMDLHFWQKPALLVPTPGQTEQEYLAAYWQSQNWAAAIDQHELTISALRSGA